MEHFSYSQHNTFNICPRLYYYKYRKRIEPLITHTYAMDFGTAIHQALYYLYQNKDVQKAIASAEPYLPPDHSRYSPEYLRTCITTYFRANKQYIQAADIVSAETPQSFDLFGVTIKFIIDLVVRQSPASVVIKDFKTSSINPGSKSYDLQADYYLYGTSSLNPSHLEFDTIITTKTPKLEIFPAFRTAHNLKSWKADLRSVLLRIAADDFPRNQSSCYAFWRPCDFTQLCFATSQAEHDHNLATLYKVKS